MVAAVWGFEVPWAPPPPLPTVCRAAASSPPPLPLPPPLSRLPSNFSFERESWDATRAVLRTALGSAPACAVASPARMLAAAALLAMSASPAFALDRKEQAMIAAVDKEAARAEALLETLVNVNSGTLNLQGVETIGAMMKAEH